MLYNLTAPQTFYCLWPVTQAQNNASGSSGVRCTWEAAASGGAAAERWARSSAARAGGASAAAAVKGEGGSGRAGLPGCPVSGQRCGHRQGQGEAARLARAREGVPTGQQF